MPTNNHDAASTVASAIDEMTREQAEQLAAEVLRRIEWLAIEGNLTPEEAVEQIASLATSYRLSRNSDGTASNAEDRASFAARVFVVMGHDEEHGWIEAAYADHYRVKEVEVQ